MVNRVRSQGQRLKVLGLLLVMALSAISPQVAAAPQAQLAAVALGAGLSQPVLAGQNLVWVQEGDLYIQNLADGKSKPLVARDGQQLAPAISGNWVVWTDNRNQNLDIYGYNLATGQERRLSLSDSNQETPVIDGNWLIWADNRNFNWDIYAYNMETAVERQLTTNTADQKKPQIAGNTVVWQDMRNFNWDIYVYDLESGQERQLTTSDAYQVDPQTDGQRVVWADRRNQNWDVYIYYLDSGVERQVTSQDKDQVRPRLAGDLVVWEDERNLNSDIYGYDLTTGKELALATGDGHQRLAGLDMATLVWTQAVDGSDYIYLQALETESGGQDLAAMPGIKVMVRGQLVEFDVPPVMRDDRVLVPIRFVAESLGATVDWDAATRTVEVHRGSDRVKLTLDSDQAVVNGQAVTLQVPALEENSRTLVPLRFVSESLQAVVDWDGALELVRID